MKVIFLLTLVYLASSIILEVPVGEKRCIYDEMAVGHKPQIFVDVVDGGKHDVHFSVISISHEETLLDTDIGTDPSHPPTFKDTEFEIPYFAEYMFCIDNDKAKYSNFVKYVDIRIIEDEFENGGEDTELLKNEDIIQISDSMNEITSMTSNIKGKQAAYRIQEEERRQTVMKTHDRVTLVNVIEIVTFLLFSLIQVVIIRRWFKSKKAILG